MTLIQSIMESLTRQQVVDFISDFWQEAEAHGRFIDNPVVHTTKYQRHTITTVIKNHHTRYLRITYGKHYAVCLVTGHRYGDLKLLCVR